MMRYLYAMFIRKKYNSQNNGLYRDDGLAVFKNVRNPASEKIKNNYNLCLSKKVCR